VFACILGSRSIGFSSGGRISPLSKDDSPGQAGQARDQKHGIVRDMIRHASCCRQPDHVRRLMIVDRNADYGALGDRTPVSISLFVILFSDAIRRIQLL
jgi:hypothetical protein